MKSSTVTAQFPCDCKTAWDIVTDNENLNGGVTYPKSKSLIKVGLTSIQRMDL